MQVTQPKNSDKTKIPFVDLHAQYAAIKDEINGAIAAVIQKGAFINGPFAREFEADFSAYVGTQYAIACGNGTDAIEIFLQAMEIGPGDEVLVPAISWISTSEAVSAVGATPVFVDIDPQSYTIDPKRIAEKITDKTKAIIPVHLYGNPADMPAIMAIAEKHDLRIIEDCAQAHGAQLNGQNIGTWGDAATFSFYPGKNLGAYGDAGAMLTNDEALATHVRMIANHGQLIKHQHHMEGRNSRMDGIQAAILRVKLRYIEEWTELRIAHADRYRQLFEGTAVTCPVVRPNSRHVYHVYAIQIADRDQKMKALKEANIACSVHYPCALPLLKPYNPDGAVLESEFPVAAQLPKDILSLPMYPEMTDAQIQRVVDTLLT